MYLGKCTSTLNVTSRFLLALRCIFPQLIVLVVWLRAKCFWFRLSALINPVSSCRRLFPTKISHHLHAHNPNQQGTSHQAYCLFPYLFIFLEKKAISVSHNVEMFSWKTTCALCPEGENGEVRTDAGTQTVFWLKILFLLSLNTGTLTRPSALFNTPQSEFERAIYFDTFKKNMCTRVQKLFQAQVSGREAFASRP